jgi:hypothetical protein
MYRIYIYICTSLYQENQHYIKDHYSKVQLYCGKIYNLLYNCISTVERDPGKRRVKPVQHHLLQLDFGGLDDSSDDSDYEVKETKGKFVSSDHMIILELSL